MFRLETEADVAEENRRLLLSPPEVESGFFQVLLDVRRQENLIPLRLKPTSDPALKPANLLIQEYRTPP